MMEKVVEGEGVVMVTWRSWKGFGSVQVGVGELDAAVGRIMGDGGRVLAIGAAQAPRLHPSASGSVPWSVPPVARLVPRIAA